jgi:hypothetical protein
MACGAKKTPQGGTTWAWEGLASNGGYAMNPNVVIFPSHDEELVAIQQEIGGALRLSLEAVTREPLPEHVAFLLYRLDVADRPKPRLAVVHISS